MNHEVNRRPEVRALASPEAAGHAWESAAARLPDWREDGGTAQLAVTLAAGGRIGATSGFLRSVPC